MNLLVEGILVFQEKIYFI